MIDLTWVLSSCVLILAVSAIRAGFGRRLRPGLRYALWALVLLRLLYPGTVLSSPVSVQSAVERTETAQNLKAVRDVDTIEHSFSGAVEGFDRQERPVTVAEEVTPERFARMKTAMRVRDVLEPIWIIGIAVTAGAFLVSNLRFYRALRRRRRPLNTACPLRVYSVENLSSSCLFGNAIYIAAETAADEMRLTHVLAHELSHYRHGDPIWALLRCVALALHWYNPLVWWAAALSRQDSELCADAGALRRLGEEERESYGATLIALSVRRASRAPLLCTATTMTNGKKSLKERVTMIAHCPRMTAAVVLAVVVIAAIAAGCAFAGTKAEEHTFPMNGKNISDLETDKILSEISKAEKLEDSSALCVNTDNFHLNLTSAFDWADDGRIRYFFTKDQTTYSATLRLFTEKNSYFIINIHQCPEQERVYKLEHYLDALKYLPQDTIRALSPDAERYIVELTDGGTPGDFDRVICYGPNGAAELERWLLQLIVMPAHEENGAYQGSGDEVIRLFYGEPARQQADTALNGEGLAERVMHELFSLRLSPAHGESAVDFINYAGGRQSVSQYQDSLYALFQDVTFEPAEIPAHDADAIELMFHGGNRLVFWEGTNDVLWSEGEGGAEQGFHVVCADK
ncbi:MAG: M56 family metallopeptidase, partial [bacterium]